MTYAQIQAALATLDVLAEQPAPAALRFRLRMATKTLRPLWSEFADARTDIIREHIEKFAPTKKALDPQDDGYDQAMKAINDLAQVRIDVGIQPLPEEAREEFRLSLRQEEALEAVGLLEPLAVEAEETPQ